MTRETPNVAQELIHIVKEINDFEQQCDEARETDVSLAWELLNYISDKLSNLADKIS